MSDNNGNIPHQNKPSKIQTQVDVTTIMEVFIIKTVSDHYNITLKYGIEIDCALNNFAKKLLFC